MGNGEYEVPLLTLDQLVQHVRELPSLPDTTIKVLKMTDDPMASARSVSSAISVDVALTSKVLKIANSAYYGMPRSVATVNEAVLILGMQALRNLALAASTYDMLRKECAGYRLAVGELWNHSLACAIAAQMITMKKRVGRPEEAFVAGLLHDVGKVVLNVHVAAQFQAIIALAELDAVPFHEAEKFILGFDHAEVGGKVAEHWNLPSPLCEAITGHHSLSGGANTSWLTAAVYVANTLSHTVSQDVDIFEPKPIDPIALEILLLQESDIEEIRDELGEMITKLRVGLE